MSSSTTPNVDDASHVTSLPLPPSRIPAPISPKPSQASVTGPPIPQSTPMAPKQTSKAIHTTQHYLYTGRKNEHAAEMVNKFVGPMPFTSFLRKFLPPPPDAEAFVFSEVAKKKFEEATSKKSEAAMYTPLLKALQLCVNDFNFVDTHASGDPNSGVLADEYLKPDLTLYPPGPPPSRTTDISKAEIVVEVKFSADDDPFTDDPKSNFVRSSEGAKNTAGQVTSYAIAQFDLQFRVHAFSILIINNYARIIYWDRAGSVVTEMLPLNGSQLAEFLWRYTRSTPEARGFDNTVMPATEEEAAEAEAELKDYESPSVDFVKFLVRNDLDPDEVYYYIGRRPVFKYNSSMTGRATRTFVVWDPERKRILFLKDTWRIANIAKEGDVYVELHNSGVQNVAPLERAGDLHQRTRAQECTGEAWARWGKKRPFRTHEHYRLVLGVVGRSLTTFKSTKELVTAVFDAIKAHDQIYKLGILHRDISVGNILILPNGRGILIDFDLCKRVEELQSARQVERSGTWQFMSARLQMSAVPLTPKFSDDLESVLLVLIWVGLLYTPNNMSPETLTRRLDIVFDSVQTKNGFMTGGEEKSAFLRDTQIRYCGFAKGPFFDLLVSLSYAFGARYMLPPPNDAHPLALQLWEDQQNKLKLLDSSDWIIELFSAALEKGGWPANDAAKMNELPERTNAYPKKRKTRTHTQTVDYMVGIPEGAEAEKENVAPHDESQTDAQERPSTPRPNKRSRIDDELEEPPSPSKSPCRADRVLVRLNTDDAA
ncbi:hypothetical protein BDN70DRAFT_842624 [Pholiota conissans]|uniref:Protein kinase domain-containing protein n=1 Tax=Pholiota conissans TaxID=109636 RepID=A0A9P5YRP6_9AGAR|nr:hypothetical protein BDN70DRAFT_842624 [Pholiota conissans]